MARNIKNLKRTSVQLPVADIEILQRLAYIKGTSISLEIRKAIRQYLALETVDQGRWPE